MCYYYYYNYSQPEDRDLWTTVRWPTGQRAATGGKVMTSGPMYGRNVASSSRTQMHSVTACEWYGTVEFNVPLDTVQVISETKLSKTDRVACHWP